MNRSRILVLVTAVLVLLLSGQVIDFTPTVMPPSESVERPAVSDESAALTPDEAKGDGEVLPMLSTDEDQYLVLGVVDGDTIDVQIGGQRVRVRYIGINTPETVHSTRGVECFGAEASARNKALVSGQFVRLEKDVSETDKYGRLLRYVYVDDVMVNEVLIAEGYANVSTYPPDVRYTERFRAAEAEARAAGKGLWGAGCEMYQSPSSQEGGAAVAPADANACTIKGNIAQETSERIYHVLGCEYYTQTVISEAKGERWFCSEDEAVAAGWRKAQNCP